MNILKSLLINVGMGDGNEVSSMRVMCVLLLLAAILPHLYLTYKTGVPQAWSEQDLLLVATALGGKLVQKHQEVNKKEEPKEQ